MNRLTERYPDLVDNRDDPELLKCVADLDATCAAFILPPERDAALAGALAARATTAERPRPRALPTNRPRLRLLWGAGRWRLASLTLATLVALSGLGAYLHGQGPTPVNAQTVLHRAAASPGPNEASHSTYRLSASSGYTGTGDVWVGTDAFGGPSEFSLTIAMVKDGAPAPELSSQRVMTGPTMQVYDPASNTVTISSPGGLDQELEGMFIGVLVAQKLSRTLEGGQQTPFTLQQQTLDGVPVYALQLERSGTQTFYFNTQSYVLQGADWVQNGRSWQARLDPASYQTMPLSAVPPHTFSLNAPATAHVVNQTPPQRATKRPQDDQIVSTAAAACHTTPQAVAAALQAGDRSMLAVCQATNPGMTADRLVDALLVPVTSQLDAQVASGALTSAQEADELAGIRAKLTAMVTGQPGTKTGTKQP